MSYINVYTGPMKCGKTSRLIEQYNKFKFSNNKIQMFKPTIDIRFEKDTVKDRNNNEIECININSIKDLLFYENEVDIYFIDEFQFLSGDINDLFYLQDKGKIFYISGLNLTAERKPFGLMKDLLCIADNINCLTSICEHCKKNNAIYTYCKVTKNQDILIGDSEYIALCPDCYNYLIKNKDD